MGSQQKEMGHKGGQRLVHDACTVRTAVCQMACLETKQHQTVKKIKPIALAVIELHLPESISQAGS